MPILKGKFFFHQISKEKSAAYYIRARAIVGQIRYIISNYHIVIKPAFSFARTTSARQTFSGKVDRNI